MRMHFAPGRPVLIAAVSATLMLGACHDQPTSASSATTAPSSDDAVVRGHNHAPPAISAQVTDPTVLKELASLRRLTASFHDIETANDAGWSEQITDCLELPGVGGMGFHYANPQFIDAEVSVLEPELLVYEPQKNGKLQLVAIEYIVPFSFVPETAEPPTLFGVPFDAVPEFQLWGLHAWVWQENPSGMFFAWNPKVTCDFAP